MQGNDAVKSLVVALEDVDVREFDEESVDDRHDDDQGAFDEDRQPQEDGHGEEGKGSGQGDVLRKGALSVLKVCLERFQLQERVGTVRGSDVAHTGFVGEASELRKGNYNLEKFLFLEIQEKLVQ